MPCDLISVRAVIRMLAKHRRRYLADAVVAANGGREFRWMHDRAIAIDNVIPDIRAMAVRARKRKVKP
jgi:hypothetical protein